MVCRTIMVIMVQPAAPSGETVRTHLALAPAETARQSRVVRTGVIGGCAVHDSARVAGVVMVKVICHSTCRRPTTALQGLVRRVDFVRREPNAACLVRLLVGPQL